MNDTEIKLVQDSFEQVVPIAETAATLFYEDLFETAQEVRPLFAKTDIKDQGAKLMTMLTVVIRGLNDLDKIVPAAETLAVRHVDYGVKSEHYGKVGASLLRTLKKGLGDDFTPEVENAWTSIYSALSTVMIQAAYGSSEAAE